MIRSLINKAVSLIIATVMLLPTVFTENIAQAEADKQAQVLRMDWLEDQYENGDMPKVKEQDFVLGDLNSAVQNGIKFNELSFIATHNSYQTQSVAAYRQIFDNLSTLTFNLVSNKTGEFSSQTLTEQFSCGIRSLEMDIETVKNGEDISFVCMHSPYLDNGTSCYDFELALKEIKMWSDYNPNHLPITIIIEPKSVFLPMENMKYMNIDYALRLDELLRTVLDDKLFEPADMLRDYNSFADMRYADDWCKVENMLGKVVVLLHDTDITEDYIKLDESIKSQAMFPMLRYDDSDLPYASFLLINEPEEAFENKEEIIDTKKLIVRTMADSYTDVSQKDLDDSIQSGAQIISTDYPVRTDSTADSYVVSFGNNKTIRLK